jgi:hypothetical protein
MSGFLLYLGFVGEGERWREGTKGRDAVDGSEMRGRRWKRGHGLSLCGAGARKVRKGGGVPPCGADAESGGGGGRRSVVRR